MKWVAVCLNVFLVLTVCYLLADKGLPRKDEVPMIAVFLAAPISSLLALFMKGGESWLGLYFKRKALEEKQKIAKLDDQDRQAASRR